MEKPFVLPAMPATSVKDSDPGDRTVTVFVDTDDAQTCKIELTGLTNEQVRDKVLRTLLSCDHHASLRLPQNVLLRHLVQAGLKIFVGLLLRCATDSVFVVELR